MFTDYISCHQRRTPSTCMCTTAHIRSCFTPSPFYPSIVMLSILYRSTRNAVVGALQEVWDQTVFPVIPSQPGGKAPDVGSNPSLTLCLSFTSSIFFLSSSLFWQASALWEQPPNSTATLMGAEAFIWQGNRISFPELPPATVHIETYIKPHQYTQRGGKFNLKVTQRKDEGLFVSEFVSLSALLCCTLNVNINKKTWFAYWWSLPEKKNKISSLLMSKDPAQRQHVQHTAICHNFLSDLDVPGQNDWLFN